MDKNEVNIAFEILLEEIENVVEGLNQEGEIAFKKQDYDKARMVIEDATKLTSFRERVKELQKEWKSIFSHKIPRRIKRRKIYAKLKRGLRTTEDEFRVPILETLIELGGKADMKNVLKRVYEKMQDKLNKYDTETLPSNPSQKRWENTVQWCRNTMVNEGLLSQNSPRGVWEITSEGRRYVNK